MSAEKQQAYDDLLENVDIKDALNLSGFDEKSKVLKFAWELECNATQEWDEFDDKSIYPSSALSYEVVRTIWLRRTAVILYNEVNQVYPWSIVPEWVDGADNLYSPKMLKQLMGWNIGYNQAPPPQWEEPPMNFFSNILNYPNSDLYGFTSNSRNPAIEMFIAHEIFAEYQPESPLEAMYAVMERMRAMGWLHESNVFSTETLGLDNANLETYWALKRSGCHNTSLVIQAVLRAFGIPAARTSFLVGHSSLWIELPSGPEVLPDGDDLYNVMAAEMPPFESFFSPDTLYEYSEQLPVYWEQAGMTAGCYVQWRITRRQLLHWLRDYWDDETYGPMIKQEFCAYLKSCKYPLSPSCGSFLYFLLDEPSGSELETEKCGTFAAEDEKQPHFGKDPEIAQAAFDLELLSGPGAEEGCPGLSP